MVIGEKLNKFLKINAAHALYRKDGEWYHQLKKFPGVLFDANGYILFRTKSEYTDNRKLQHGQELHVPNGISSLKGYIKFNEEQLKKVRELTIEKKIKERKLDVRSYMHLAIDEMRKSISEPREDGQANPKVGAVLISSIGEVLATAHRGELREGDHAEYTLLDRKLRDRNVTGSILFATLEPCADGARKPPKIECARRIVNARIKKVYVGIEDPDPKVSRKGIKFLMDSKVEVEMFDKDLQDIIEKENKQFLDEATLRAKEVKKPKLIELSTFERIVPKANILEEFSQEALKHYIKRTKLNTTPDNPEFLALLEQQQLIEYDETSKRYKPTGLSILLFGKNPRNRYPQAVLKTEARYGKSEPEIQDFDDALVLVPDKVEAWLKKVLSSRISRKKFARSTEYDYPPGILREAIINALVHRDYEIGGAKCYLYIDDTKIVVRSPGKPVDPIKLEDLQEFKAPSLSRNPKLMAVFNSMDYVEERGIGMREMKSLPEVYHLPLPEVTWEEPYLTITFPRTEIYFESIIGSKAYNQLNEEERQGLVYIHDQNEVSKAQYREHFDFNDKKAQRHLLKFKKLKLVTPTGKGPSSKYVFKKL